MELKAESPKGLFSSHKFMLKANHLKPTKGTATPSDNMGGFAVIQLKTSGERLGNLLESEGK